MDRSNCFVGHFIRNESLADDFIQMVQSCGIDLSDAQRDSVLTARKVNTSTRPHGPSYYYDEASIKLVARRERFIIEKFGYGPARPRLDTAKVAPVSAPMSVAPAQISVGARLIAEAAAARQWRKQQKAQREAAVSA